MEHLEKMTPAESAPSQNGKERSFDFFDCLDFIDDHFVGIAVTLAVLGIVFPPLFPFVMTLLLGTVAAAVVGSIATMVFGVAGSIVFVAAELLTLYLAFQSLGAP